MAFVVVSLIRGTRRKPPKGDQSRTISHDALDVSFYCNLYRLSKGCPNVNKVIPLEIRIFVYLANTPKVIKFANGAYIGHVVTTGNCSYADDDCTISFFQMNKTHRNSSLTLMTNDPEAGKLVICRKPLNMTLRNPAT